MAYKILYYKTLKGKEPLRDFLNSLDEKAEQKIYAYLQKLEDEGFLPFPYSRKIEGVRKLRELRIPQGTNIYRVFYFMYRERTIVLLHAFKKKTQKTPKREVVIAKDRMEHILGGG